MTSKGIPNEKLSREISVGEIIIECYHLDNNLRVISGRGLQKILDINTKIVKGKKIEGSGNALKQTISILKNVDGCPDKVDSILDTFNNRVVKFKRVGAGGSVPITHGFEATFLMDICHFIQDMKIAGILPDKFSKLLERATIVERAYSKLGIIAHIDEATSYQYERDKIELEKILCAYVSKEAAKWQLTFSEDYDYHNS